MDLQNKNFRFDVFFCGIRKLSNITILSAKESYPDEYRKREADKLNYRYPGVGGESYQDVIERMRPVIIELERQRRSVVVACHLAVLRYFDTNSSWFSEFANSSV